MVNGNVLIDDLLPCPFCGGTNTQYQESRLAPTMQGPGSLISASVKHWCETYKGVVGAFTEFRGRQKEDAIAAWNRRKPNPTEGTANG